MLVLSFGLVISHARGDSCRQSVASANIGLDLYDNDVSCGGALSFRGRLESPNLPGKKEYPSLCNCTWTIGDDEGYADVEVTFAHFQIDATNRHCQYDHLQIFSSGGDSRLMPKTCGDTLPEKISGRAKLPLKIVFTSDEDIHHPSGFTLEYEVVRDASDVPAATGQIRSEQVPAEETSSVSTGLIIGILLIAVIGLSAALVCFKRQQTKDNGMDGIGLEDFTLAPPENIYEDLDQTARSDEVLLRTESQDSIAQEKMAALNADRELPPLPPLTDNDQNDSES